MTKIKLTVLAFVLFTSFNMFSQEKEEEEKGFTVTGSVDVYHTSNLKSGSPGSVGILYAGSAAANGFGLGMVNTVFTYEKGKAGVVADLSIWSKSKCCQCIHRSHQSIVCVLPSNR